MQKNNRKRVENHAQEKPIPDRAPAKVSITDAVVLAGLTVFSYIFHYFFEYGYLSFFDIPAAFISFNLNEMIPAMLLLVVAYFLFVFFLWPYLNAVLTRLPGFVKTIIIVSPWLLIFVFFGVSWETLLLLLFGMLLLFGIYRMREDRTRRTVREKAVDIETKSSFDWLVSRRLLGGDRSVLLYLLFTALAGSFAFGRVAAMTRTSFLVSDSSPDCAVVYATSERYLCKPFDNNKAFDNTFQIFYYQENQSMDFRNESIGPLHLDPALVPTRKPLFRLPP